MAKGLKMKKIFSKIISYWKSQGVLLCNTINNEDLNKIETSMKIRFPKEFRILIENVADGFFNGHHDDNHFSFLNSQDYFKTRGTLKKNEDGLYIVFIDYMHWSWGYAIYLKEEDQNYGGIFMVGTENGEPNKIADNVEEFLELYIEDSERLYPLSET